jgi:phosphoglycolate phosphatase
MMPARLALFDCDGTLADSQHEIVAAMNLAFASLHLPPPPAAAIRTNIGLSLPGIAAVLLPEADEAGRAELVDAYREAYLSARTAPGAEPEPLYEGIREVLNTLTTQGWLLGVATGKSRRGLDRLLAAHSLTNQFATLQTADRHPSKPHPAMIEAACAETGVAATETIVIGDTDFDMAMAMNGGARAIGVSWGYHDTGSLIAAGAEAIAESPADLLSLLES